MDRIENKLLDKMGSINVVSVISQFDCTNIEAGEIINRFLENRKSFKGEIDLTGTINVRTLASLTKCGRLIAQYSELEDFGDLKIVNGDIHIVMSPFITTGKLIYCGSLSITGCVNFNKINKLVEVNGDVDISGCHDLVNLGSLDLLAGGLSLFNNQKLKSLGHVEGVLGNLTIGDCPNLNSLCSIDYIRGSLDLRNSDLHDFGVLSRLDGFVIANKSNTTIKDYDDLEVLDLSPLRVLSPNLPNIEYLIVPKVDSLRNFGLVIIDDSDQIFKL